MSWVAQIYFVVRNIDEFDNSENDDVTIALIKI